MYWQRVADLGPQFFATTVCRCFAPQITTGLKWWKATRLIIVRLI